MARLVVIRDFFKPYQREILPANPGVPLRDLVPEDLPRENLQAIYLGAVVKDPEFIDVFCFRHDVDEVILRVLPGDPFSLIGALVISAVSLGISYGIQALMPPPQLENKQIFDNTQNSPTYGWEGIQNTLRNGTPIPLVFGKHKVGGHLLSTFVKVLEDGKSVLHMLVGLCAGPVSAINDYTSDTTTALTGSDISSDLKINTNAGNLFEGLEVSYRLGSWVQSMIHGFNDIIDGKPQNEEIAFGSPYTYTTTGKVQAVELLFRFPTGLFRLNVDGAFLAYEIELTIEYRESGVAGWTTHGTYTFSNKTRSEYNKMIRIDDLDAAVYEVKMTRNTAADGTYETSTCYLISVNEINYDDVVYKGVALVGIKALATEHLHGRLPTVTNVVYGVECTVYKANDVFGEDSRQDFVQIGDGKCYWGWTAENMAKVDTCTAYETTPGMMYFKHTTETSNLDETTNTAPKVYKSFYGTGFDVDVRGRFLTGSSSAGDGICLAVQSVSAATERIQAIGLYNDSGTYKWRVTDDSGAGYENSGTVTINENYYRIVMDTNGDLYFYTSTTGSSWTLRDTRQTFTGGMYNIMFACYCDTSTSGQHVGFTDFNVDDTTSYSIECSNNPAWIIYWLLTNTDYGLGNYINESQIDLTSFQNFAAYANENANDGLGSYHKRYSFDGILDDSRSAWERLLQICELYRATLLLQGDKIRIAYQHESDPVQVFSITNIVKGSFQTSYQTPKVGANYWEVQFLNKDNDYGQDYAIYLDPAIEDGESYRKQTVSAYGVTRPAEAYRGGLFKAKSNRYMTQTISFKAGIDAITCEPYDVISVSHTVPAWGIDSGRVQSATSTTAVLDRPVTFELGYIYEITIRHNADDSIETQTCTNSPGLAGTITVAGWDTTPSADDLWVVGQQDILTKNFMVTSIERSGDFECKIEAVEYNADVYDDTILELPVVTYTELPDPRSFPEDISHLVLSERAQLMKDGSIQSVIDVTFATSRDAQSYDIYMREFGKTNWQYQGSTQGTHFVIIGNLTEQETYEVAVVAVGPFGAKKHPDNSPSQIILVEGKTGRPANVSAIWLSRVGDTLKIEWAHVADSDLAGYELRYSEANDWQGATVLAFLERKTSFFTSDFPEGTLYFFVKALNTSGIYSETAAYVQETVPDRQGQNILVSRDERDLGWNGTKTNMSVSGSDLVLDTSQTSGSYVTPEMDAGATVRAEVRVQVQISQDDVSFTWASSTFTWGSATAQNTTWAGNPEGIQMEHAILFRYGTATPLTGDYATWVKGEYTGRYFQFKLTVDVDSTAYSATVYEMKTEVDPPDIFEKGQNVAISSTGSTTINFSNFNVTPTFVAQPNGGAAGDTVRVVSISSSSASVQYYDASDTQIAGNIDWTAVGY